MNVKPKFVYYDIRRKQSVGLIMYTHENDVDTQVLEVSMIDNGEPIELSVDYTYSAAIVNRDTKALINDNISCTLNESGNVLIPIDNFHTLGAQDLLIELTITDSAGNQVLVTPFPLWIHVNASILDDAQVTPESLGTVPELLEEAKGALETVGDYDNLTHKPQINGHELVGNKAGDDLGLQNKLTAGENITIDANGEISATGGVTSYTELSDKPQINGHELVGNKTGDDLGLQGKLTAGENVTIENGVISASVPTIYKTGGLQFEPLDNIAFSSDDFSIRIISSGLYNLLEINNSYFKCYLNVDFSDKYDFNRINKSYWRCGAYLIYAWNILNLPTAFTDVNVNGFITIFNFIGGNGRTDIRAVIYETVSGKTKVFVQLVSLLIDENNPEYKFPVHSSEWIELSSTISSAAVNQNGTITFTMSDGSTVTTTGESVIGPQGPAGADGNDYVLTAQDKSDIAAIVLSELPTTQGVQYGNSND